MSVVFFTKTNCTVRRIINWGDKSIYSEPFRTQFIFLYIFPCIFTFYSLMKTDIIQKCTETRCNFHLLGWVQYENHIYRIFTENKNWDDAKVHEFSWSYQIVYHIEVHCICTANFVFLGTLWIKRCISGRDRIVWRKHLDPRKTCLSTFSL